MHEFKIRHQFSEIRGVKENLKQDELLIHIDFSENYSCKRGEEVQAAHFGNRSQVTIHQGVCYRPGSPANGFVTLSDDKRKSADAIAAHVNAILIDLSVDSVKKVRKIHVKFFLDFCKMRL